jgi:uncharacterized protein (TIGR02271 family)
MTGERSEYTGREVVAEIPSVDLYTSDQDKIGRVLEIGPEWVIVDRDGLFSGGNLWIPANRVSGDPQSGQVTVDVSKDQIGDMGWDQEPEMRDGAYVSSSDTGSTNDRSYADATTGGYTESQTTEYADTTATSYADTGNTGYAQTTDSDGERIRVHEEELQARKVAEEAGAVQVRKDVVEEQREIEVPVLREEVEVTRHAVSGDVTADSSAFQDTGDTIRVPIVEERVEVRKVPHVVEEIEISKRQVQDTERVTDTVRREEVHVEETGTSSGTTDGYTSGTTGTTGEYETTDTSTTGTVGQNRQGSGF